MSVTVPLSVCLYSVVLCSVVAADRSCLAADAVCSMSLRYDGAEVVRTLCVSTVVLYVMRCCTGSQCSSDCSRGAAPVRPPRWQTTRARLFCARWRLLMVTVGAPYSRALQ